MGAFGRCDDVFNESEQARRLMDLTNRLDGRLAETSLGRMQKILSETSLARTAEISKRLRPMVGMHGVLETMSPLVGVARALDVIGRVGATTTVVQAKAFEQFKLGRTIDTVKLGRTIDAVRLGSSIDALQRLSSMPWLGVLAEAQRLAKSTALDPHEVEYALSAWNALEAEAEDDKAASADQGLSIRLPKLSAADWIGLFSILLSILMYFIQKKDSAESEARQISASQKLTQRVANLEQVVRDSDANIARVAAVLEQMSSSPPHAVADQYVARNRPSSVREARASGRTIALVYPNQLAECLAADGKWMRIRYTDWANSEVVEGWVMKKHWMRVPLHSPGSAKCD